MTKPGIISSVNDSDKNDDDEKFESKKNLDCLKQHF